MSYTLDAKLAKSADAINQSIRESGKFKGIITRAEELSPTSGAKGIGLSFKSDCGSSADYLDLYTSNAAGEPLFSAKIVQAIMACLKIRSMEGGQKVQIEKWDKDAGARVKVVVPGYPELMGKRIGLLLQKELSTHSTKGTDSERMVIFGVFQPDTELVASEVLDQITKPERLSKMVESLAAKPVNDRRTKRSAPVASASGRRQDPDDGGAPGWDDDGIPF